MNKLFIFSTIVILFSCTSKSKLETTLNLDSAITKGELSGIYTEATLPDTLGTVTTKEDRVYFKDKNDQISDFEQFERIVNTLGEPYTGKIIRKYKSGKLKYEVSCNKGYFDGYERYFYENGNLKSQCFFKNGKMDGSYESYYLNKKIFKKFYVMNGNLKAGKMYFPDGKISYQGEFEKGERKGKHMSYYQNGQLAWEGSYPFGLRRDGFFANKMENGYRADGLFQEFFEDGSLKYNATYKNGLPDGTEIAYHSKKQIQYKRFWINRMIVGNVVTYHLNGCVEQIGQYNKEGKADGEWKEFYEDGKLRLIVQFKSGKIIEQHYFAGVREEHSEIQDLRTVLPGSETRF